jgi:hypothetical protein
MSQRSAGCIYPGGWGLTTTIQNFAAKNEGLYSKFNIAYEQNPEKVGDWKTKAEELKTRSDELYEFMNECKVEIVSKKDEDAVHDGEVHLADVGVKDDTNFPGEVMIVNKKGAELKQRIEDHREFLLSMIDDKEKYAGTVGAIEGNLSTEVPEDFHHHAKKGPRLPGNPPTLNTCLWLLSLPYYPRCRAMCATWKLKCSITCWDRSMPAILK